MVRLHLECKYLPRLFFLKSALKSRIAKRPLGIRENVQNIKIEIEKNTNSFGMAWAAAEKAPHSVFYLIIYVVFGTAQFP